MKKESVVILDIGSSSISAIIGNKSVNDTYFIRAEEKVDTYPFYGGAFCDVNKLRKEISILLCDLKKANNLSSIERIFVGVPGEFVKVRLNNGQLSSEQVEKVSLGHIKYLFDSKFENIDQEHEIIHQSAVYYSLDGNRVENPIGKYASSIRCKLSYVYVNSYFKDTIDKILTDLGVKIINYISIDFAEATYLFTGDEYRTMKALIDCGCSTTSLSISYGEGLLYLGAFASGGGLISAHLSNAFGCTYTVADELRKKINVGLAKNPQAVYEFHLDDQYYSFPRDEVNQIAKDVLDDITAKIYQLISECDSVKVQTDIQMYFTGGGVCFMKGAVEYITNSLGLFPKTIAPSVPKYNKESYSSKISLLATALKYKNDKLFFSIGG